MPKSDAQHITDIGRINPAARSAQLGQVVADLIATVNALSVDNAAMLVKHNALLGKLDADAGVTDTNYAALHSAPAATATAVTPLSTR